MTSRFKIPIRYQQKELEFDAHLLNLGYSCKIVADVNGIEVSFEPDEERNFRAVVNPVHQDQMQKLHIGLLKAIAVSIEAATN